MAKFKSLIWTQVFQLVSRFKKYILIISDPEGSLFESELDNFFQRVKCEVLVILGPMNGRWRSVEGECWRVLRWVLQRSKRRLRIVFPLSLAHGTSRHISLSFSSHQSNIRCDSVAFEISPTAPRI